MPALSLRARFREFFVELQAQKANARLGLAAVPRSAGDSSVSAARPGGTSALGPTAGPAAAGTVRGPHPAWEAIAELLRRQAREVESQDAMAQRAYHEAQYAMAALADQVFIVDLGEWPGRSGWSEFPLEKAFYKTQVAGEEIFRRIDRLLQSGDPQFRELAEVYFNVLSLGFLGKFGIGRGRGQGLVPAEIHDYRRRLHYFFTGGSRPAPARVSEHAYERIETMNLGGKIPSVAQSIGLFAVVALVLVVATFGLRAWLTSETRTELEELQRRLPESSTSPNPPGDGTQR